MQIPYKIRIPDNFWSSGLFLKEKYNHDDYREIILIIRAAINELKETGQIRENGWNEHQLIHRPFADGNHFEFHIYDDDTLVVYFKRESKHTIRMIGIYDHETLPNED